MSARQKVVERVALDDTRALLQQLGLEHAAEVLADQLSLAVKEDVAHHRFVDRLLGVEAQRREENRVRTSLRLSGLPTGQTLDNFDWSFWRPANGSGRARPCCFRGHRGSARPTSPSRSA